MIISIGEILVDMIGTRKNEKVTYENFIGGAPFNLACNIKKLGGKVGFVGRIGEDLIGDFLHNKAKEFNFDYLSLQKDKEHNTTIALVSIAENGERSFSFLRKQCADYLIDSDLINDKYFNKAKIIHIGSLMLSEKEGRDCFMKILNKAKSHKKIVSFDINYRKDLFENNQEAIAHIRLGIKSADILKFSEEELYMISGKKTLEEAVNCFDNNQLVFVTLSSKGSICFYNSRIITASSINVTPIDTTGAGDAFYAAILKQIDEKGINRFNGDILMKIMTFANICGALTTTAYGAVDAFPTKEEIEKYYGAL